MSYFSHKDNLSDSTSDLKIPKTIHYCWFGRNDKPFQIKDCILTWEYFLPDYDIIEWNEDSYDTQINSYTSDCYKKKKWAHLSDYVRADVLYKYGGVYLDVDVTVNRNLDMFLRHSAFSGFEMPGVPFTAVWGTEKGHMWPRLVCEHYERIGVYVDETINSIVTKMLSDQFGIDKNNDTIQRGSNGIVIYPTEYFTIKAPINFTTHQFLGSWLNEDIEYAKYCNSVFYASYINRETALRYIKYQCAELDLVEILFTFRFRIVLKSIWLYFVLKIANKNK